MLTYAVHNAKVLAYISEPVNNVTSIIHNQDCKRNSVNGQASCDVVHSIGCPQGQNSGPLCFPWPSTSSPWSWS